MNERHLTAANESEYCLLLTVNETMIRVPLKDSIGMNDELRPSACDSSLSRLVYRIVYRK